MILGSCETCQHPQLLGDRRHRHAQAGQLDVDGLADMQRLPAIGTEHFQPTHQLHRQTGETEAGEVRAEAVAIGWHMGSVAAVGPERDQLLRIAHTGQHIEIGHRDRRTGQPRRGAAQQRPAIPAKLLQVGHHRGQHFSQCSIASRRGRLQEQTFGFDADIYREHPAASGIVA